MIQDGPDSVLCPDREIITEMCVISPVVSDGHILYCLMLEFTCYYTLTQNQSRYLVRYQHESLIKQIFNGDIISIA